MKTFSIQWARPVFLFILSLFLLNATFAQSTRKQKQDKKQAEIKGLVEANNYIFKAEYVQPMRGTSRYITSEYDFKVGKDSLIAYLPYFGRAYVAPINPEDAGMMFTATHFDYKLTESKNGWDVSIKTKDAKDVQNVNISISKDGYATLHINSINREPISYQGYIDAIPKKKV